MICTSIVVFHDYLLRFLNHSQQCCSHFWPLHHSPNPSSIHHTPQSTTTSQLAHRQPTNPPNFNRQTHPLPTNQAYTNPLLHTYHTPLSTNHPKPRTWHLPHVCCCRNRLVVQYFWCCQKTKARQNGAQTGGFPVGWTHRSTSLIVIQTKTFNSLTRLPWRNKTGRALGTSSGRTVDRFESSSLIWGWQDGLEVRSLTSKLFSLGSNLDPAINCHLGVSQAG